MARYCGSMRMKVPDKWNRMIQTRGNLFKITPCLYFFVKFFLLFYNSVIIAFVSLFLLLYNIIPFFYESVIVLGLGWFILHRLFVGFHGFYSLEQLGSEYKVVKVFVGG